MFWLPPLTVGCRSRLPLGHAGVAAMAEVLLAATEVPSMHAADSMSRRSSWFVALSQDPGLLLWSVCRSGEDGAHLQTVRQVSDWFLAGGWRCLAQEMTAAIVDPVAFDATAQARYADRLVAAVRAAELARRRAESDGADALSEQAYLRVLLSSPEQWFVSEGGESESATLPQSLLRWFSSDSPAAYYVHLASQQQESDAGLSPQADEIRRGWLSPVPTWDRHLPVLLNRLSRLAQLESDFQWTLEAEKLESLAEFAAGAGHEINNPLAVISGRAQLFLRHEKDPERRRELAVINSQAMRVHEMIADLMLFARPPRPRPVNCDLVAILDSIAADISARAAECGVAIVRVWPSAGISLRADPVQLQVALRAVCDNALNALSRGGRLEITARQASPTTVQIVLQDNGPGIPPEVRRHLFDPFFSGSGAGRGLGLGLSKCWRIVTQHGGQIDVVSDLGRGAQFTITLPVAGPVTP
jgi:signal transduction histidine kinase